MDAMESPALSSPSSQSNPATNVNKKIHDDLQIVVDKMNGCETLLKSSNADPTQELLAVVGFLEACQPRMIELVEAAAQGALSEQVLMECLQVNDRLTKILNDVDTQVDFENASAMDSSAIAGATASPQFVIQEEKEPAVDDLLLMEDFDHISPIAAAAAPDNSAAAGPKTTGEDLDDLLDLNIDTMEELALGDDEELVVPTKSEDDFDNFISARQTDQ
jgi:hypothetical protein